MTCSGPTKPPISGPAHMDPRACLLLELAASDDLPAFKLAVEHDAHPIDAAALWYARSLSPPHRMRFDLRTPLAIAASFGSTAVLTYILSSSPTLDVDRRCASDGATALHCAAAGGSPVAARLLLDASADRDALDSSGNRPADVIARHASSSATRALELILKAPAKQSAEKREYPPDATLPNIKNGIYGTDEFRMYAFKITPCSRAYSHDWTECPFVHPGENARRRDPRKYVYSCVPCPEFRKGSCRSGDACEYAHGVFECWLHPVQYRTRLCKDEIGCSRRVCFFAHKPEELRLVNLSAASASGLGISSPRSHLGSGVASLDMAAAMLMMQLSSGSGSVSPMSPSASFGMGQLSSVMTPTLQLPSSRLKSTLSARDWDRSLGSLGLDAHQLKLINEIDTATSPKSNWAAARTNASRMSDYSDIFGSFDASLLAQAQLSASRTSNYNELFGSVDPSMLSHLQGGSIKAKAGGAATAQVHQSMDQQMFSAYGSNMTHHSPVSVSSSKGLDHSVATAIMNSRASAFAKRSHSFCEQGAVVRHPSLPTAPSGLSNWGSPVGKLDWGVKGEELNKLRKAASFNYLSNSSSLAATTAAAQALDESELSWTHSLVNDGPELMSQLNQQQQLVAEEETFPAWAEQMYMEQEQMVA